MNQIEHRFNRAIKYSLSKFKFFLVFFVLIFCSLIITFFNYLSNGIDNIMGVSLIFIATFFIFGILLSTGVFLIRIYYHEVKELNVRFFKILEDSWQIMIGAFYLFVPGISIYLILWILLILFFLLSQIPTVGPILIFGPYLLVFSALLLIVSNIIFLFLVTPILSLKRQGKLIIEIFKRLKFNFFYNFLSLITALLPLIIIVSLLCLTKMLSFAYIPLQDPFSLALQTFFIFVPICAIITPFVIFFFNFSAEMHQFYKNS